MGMVMPHKCSTEKVLSRPLFIYILLGKMASLVLQCISDITAFTLQHSSNS